MAKTVIIPLVNRTIPLSTFLSIKSVKELINATPGTKNKIDVARADSGSIPMLKYIPKCANDDAVKDARKTLM